MTHLTLADRVRMMHAGKWTTSADLAELLADIAAADRLARAALVVADYRGMRMELTRRVDIGDTTALVYDANAWYQTGEDYKSALDAYRARMAQGVARGE